MSRLPSRPAEGAEARPAKLFAPLHQAAHGRAPAAVVRQLLDLGAWRSLRTAGGQTAHDIAVDNVLVNDEVRGQPDWAGADQSAQFHQNTVSGQFRREDFR